MGIHMTGHISIAEGLKIKTTYSSGDEVRLAMNGSLTGQPIRV
jgi:hypothetical protein